MSVTCMCSRSCLKNINMLPWHCHGTAKRNELEVLLCICMVPWLRRRSTLGCASLYGNPHKRRTRIHHYPSGIQFFCFFFWGGGTTRYYKWYILNLFCRNHSRDFPCISNWLDTREHLSGGGGPLLSVGW